MEGHVECKRGYTSQDFKLRQKNVGAITVETLFYDHQQKTYRQQVTIYKPNPDKTGYGEVIFRGTLEELIARLGSAK